MMINISDIHRCCSLSLHKTVLLPLGIPLFAFFVLVRPRQYLLVSLLTKDDHCLDLGLQDDIVIDDGLIEVDDHILADDYLPLPPVLLLDGFLES